MHQDKLNDILEIVTFIKDNAASKKDLEPLATKGELSQLEERMATKDDLAQVKTDLITHIDSFVVLH